MARQNTIDLTRVADLLAINGMTDRAGPLLDRAAELDPGDARPLWMSIRLAPGPRTRSAWGTRSSGSWPWAGPAWMRPGASRPAARSEALAKTLREDGRDADASALLQRLEAAEPRDLVLILTWTGDADLDLAVTEPLGATAPVATPRTVFGGAIVKNGYGKHPEEVYVCPRAFDGDYVVRVETIYDDQKNAAREATLTVVTHEGTDQEHKETHTISLAKPEPVTVHLTGGRRKKVLPFHAMPTAPVLATPGTRPAPAPTPARAADALRLPTPQPAPNAKPPARR